MKALFVNSRGNKRVCEVIERNGKFVKLRFTEHSRWELATSIQAVPDHYGSKINQQRTVEIIRDNPGIAALYWKSGKAPVAAAVTLLRILEARGAVTLERESWRASLTDKPAEATTSQT